MAQLGNVNIDGLDLSAAMRNDLSGGMSVAAFNSKYAGSGFQPISASRQVGSSAPAAAAAPNNGPDSSALFQFADQYKNDYQNMLNAQNAKQDGLFQQYTDQLNSQEKLPDLYTRLQNELGIPDTSKAITGYKTEIYRVKDLLDRLSDDVTSRSLGSYTTQAMRDRIQASEQAPLETQLSRLGTGMQPLVDLMTGAQSQLSALLPLYMQQQEKDLSPITMQINALGDRFAREITGFTTERQQSLTAILDQIQRGRELSDRDWQLAQDLAKEERDYQHNLSLAKATASAQYMSTANPTYGTSATNGSNAIKQLPSISSQVLSVQPTISGRILQPASSGISLQGSSPLLQGGSGISLQGGSIRLQ